MTRRAGAPAAPLPAAVLALALLAATPAPAQDLRASVALGPRLLDYPVSCEAGSECRITCFQNGVKILDRGGLAPGDRIRLVASAGVSGELTPRWFEIRPASDSRVQTLLLTRDTFCDLQALTIAHKSPP